MLFQSLEDGCLEVTGRYIRVDQLSIHVKEPLLPLLSGFHHNNDLAFDVETPSIDESGDRHYDLTEELLSVSV